MSVAIVIPARNERDRIGACLESVAVAVRQARIPCTVVVIDDGSSDGTADAARRALRGTAGEVTSCKFANVGAARRLGVEVALASFEPEWLAFTDADTLVPTSWLTHQAHYISHGADAVAGLVQLERSVEPRLRRAFESAYRRGIGPFAHNHIHGANLAIRTSAYEFVGGFRPMATSEDADIWQRLGEAGFRLATAPELIVTTSARTQGRAAGGVASDLARLAQGLSPSTS